MLALFKNVTIEEPKGQVSSKDASKFYGSAILKFKDPETNKKSSLQIKVSTDAMVKQLEIYESDETLCDVSLQIEVNKFDPKTVVLGEIHELTIVA